MRVSVKSKELGEVSYRAPTSTGDKELLVCMSVNDPAVFDLAYRFLDDFAFSKEPTPELGLLWSYHRKHSQAGAVVPAEVAHQQLTADVRSRDDLSVKERKLLILKLTRLRQMIDRLPTDKVTQLLAIDCVKRYASELAYAEFRFRADPVSGMVTDAEGVVARLALKLSQIHAAVGDEHTFSEFSDLSLLVKEATYTESCGINSFDVMLNGGQAPEEVYALAGPTGSCKTTTAVQMAVSQAKRFDTEYRLAVRAYNRQRRAQPRRRLIRPIRRVVHMFVYEDDRVSMVIRVLACAASIVSEQFRSLPGDVLEDPKSVAGNPILTRMSKGSGDLKDYERRLFQEQISAEGISVIPGELQRFTAAARLLDKHLVLHDMRGGSKSGVGRGGVSELAGCLRGYLTSHPDTKVGSVFIDYAKLLISKQLEAEGTSKPDHLRFATSSFPMQVKNQVAEQFVCPVWVLQQLDASANSLRPGKTASRTSFPEAKDFLENMNFGFIASAVTADSYVVVDCVKHRRGPHAQKAVFHLRGEMCQIKSAPGMVARADGQVLSREEAGRLEPAAVTTAAVPLTAEEISRGYME